MSAWLTPGKELQGKSCIYIQDGWLRVLSNQNWRRTPALKKETDKTAPTCPFYGIILFSRRKLTVSLCKSSMCRESEAVQVPLGFP